MLVAVVFNTVESASGDLIYYDPFLRHADAFLYLTPDVGDSVSVDRLDWYDHPGTGGVHVNLNFEWGDQSIYLHAAEDSTMEPTLLESTIVADMQSSILTNGLSYFAFAWCIFEPSFMVDTPGIYAFQLSAWASNTGTGDPSVYFNFNGLTSPLFPVQIGAGETYEIPPTLIQLDAGSYSFYTTTSTRVEPPTSVSEPFEAHAELSFRLEYVIPEPGTLGLLILGSLILMRRRR